MRTNRRNKGKKSRNSDKRGTTNEIELSARIVERTKADKLEELDILLKRKPVDISLLQRAARSEFGLVNQETRKKAWELLLNLEPEGKINSSHSIIMKKHSPWKKFAKIENKYDDQVQKDVERSVIGFTEADRLSDADRYRAISSFAYRIYIRTKLKTMIMAILSKNKFHYFQGFNTFCSIFLIVLEEKLGFYATETVSKYLLKDLFYESFDVGLNPLLGIMKRIIKELDPQIYELMEIICYPTFAVPWILTWFSHNLDNLGDISRIFDFCIASHPLAIVYLSAATVIHMKSHLPDIRYADSEEIFASVHYTFQTMKLNSNAIEKICQKAEKFMQSITPTNITTTFLYLIPNGSPLIDERASLPYILWKNNKYSTSSSLPCLPKKKNKKLRMFIYASGILSIAIILLLLYLRVFLPQ